MSNKSFTELPSEAESKIDRLIASIISADRNVVDNFDNSDYVIRNLYCQAVEIKSEIAYEQWKAGVFAEWTDSFACRTKDGWMIIPSYKHFATTDELYNSEEYAQYLQTLKQPTQ